MPTRQPASRLRKFVPFDAGRVRVHRDGHAAVHRPDLAAAREDLVQSVVSPALLVRA
ncbi:MAG: hypothetical protein ABSD57_01510 [Verrucomicrobiota bacterium]